METSFDLCTLCMQRRSGSVSWVVGKQIHFEYFILPRPHNFRYIRTGARAARIPHLMHTNKASLGVYREIMSIYSFGQLVIGPPGSGKSTYCKAMKEFMSALGRKVVVVNLDPANDSLPYECAVDVSELITLQDVMDRLKLGPNGSLIYCMEYLEKNLEWLKNQLDKFKNQYFLFDCPGQVELFTHHCSVRNIAHQLEKWKFKVCSSELPG